MQPSPLNFLQLNFIKTYVEADGDADTPATEFQFEGVLIGWQIHHGRNDDDETWWIAARFFVDNENAKVRCPYRLDMRAMGLFLVDEHLKEEKHEKLVYENGAALIYGAIRDMVSMITSRSVHGSLMLPTPTFMGTYAKYLAKKATTHSEGSQ